MTIGYKATYNYKCLKQTYEIGQEYKLDDKPVLCRYGFHYCLKANLTLYYYNNYDKDFKLLEIEDLNPNDTITDLFEDKYCSNHIRIIREIVDENELLKLLKEVYEFNSSGHVIKYKDFTGYWCEKTYDVNGQVLTYKNSNGKTVEFEYDENGRRIL